MGIQKTNEHVNYISEMVIKAQGRVTKQEDTEVIDPLKQSLFHLDEPMQETIRTLQPCRLQKEDGLLLGGLAKAFN